MASTIGIIKRPALAQIRRLLLQRSAAFSTTIYRRNNANNNNVSSDSELGVGELQGTQFRIEPLRRVGEDDATKRARLTYQSRKRGILESDLLLSTFAAQHLPTMTSEELHQYDLFLDENDWDIYYWATQREPSSSTNPSVATSPASASSSPGFEESKDTELPRDPPKGEWAQTIGNFKPAYRPVPTRWRDSQILERLREHVRSRSVDGGEGTGMAFMPALKSE